jgi:hypothetical protein
MTTLAERIARLSDPTPDRKNKKKIQKEKKN